MSAMRKAFEAHFHSKDQVQGYIEEALSIFHYVDVPEELVETAFAKAVDLLAQKQVTFEAVAPTGVLLDKGRRM